MSFIRKPIDFLLSKLNRGHEQSVELKRNILVSVIIKFFSLALGLFYMPTILTYVDKSLLGIVMTLDSFVTWLYLADIGIGNGLKNHLTAAISLNDTDRAKRLVSTAYVALFSIMFVVFIVASIAATFINWNSVLKVDIDSQQLLWSVRFIIFSLLMSFCVRLINTVLQANQMMFLNGITDLVIKVLKLLTILVAIRISTASLFKYVLIDHGIPLIVLIIFSVILYSTIFKQYSPSPKLFCKDEVKNITSLGFKFFFVQIAAMVLFTTDNIIITRLFSTADVTVYNMARHYYSQAQTIFSFVSAPMWTAYTKAYVREDFTWIKSITKKLTKIGGVLAVLIVIMFIFHKPVIKFWLRGKIELPMLLAIFMGLSIMLQIFVAPFSLFINGTGKIKLSMILSPIVIVLNIPLSILFAKPLGMGIAGVIAGTAVCNLASLIVSSIQYHKIVNHKATGIWNQ